MLIKIKIKDIIIIETKIRDIVAIIIIKKNKRQYNCCYFNVSKT